MDWKPEFDAIVGARHGGRTDTLLAQLTALDKRYPHVAEILYQLAWTLETAGRETEAVIHYERAIALGLPPNELSGALIGLSNAVKASGEIERAVQTLRTAQLQFPDNREIDVHLALALHQGGDHREAIEILLTTLLETTEDVGITAYQRALRFQLSKLGSKQ